MGNNRDQTVHTQLFQHIADMRFYCGPFWGLGT